MLAPSNNAQWSPIFHLKKELKHSPIIGQWHPHAQKDEVFIVSFLLKKKTNLPYP
jgi:hypothetical protein